MTAGRWGAAVLSCSLLPLVGCGSPSTPAATVVSLMVAGEPPRVGAFSAFTANVSLSDGTTLNVTPNAVWTSTDETVATVTSAGVVTGVRTGSVTIRATFQGATGGRSFPILPAVQTFEQNYLDSIVFGNGPLTPSDGLYACPWRSRWSAFPRGTTVRLRISTTVTQAIRTAIELAVAQVHDATLGNLHVTTELTDDPNPIPGTHEATVTTHPSPASQGCGSDIGCTFPLYASPGVLRASRAVLPPNQTINAYVHDIVGHGLIGLCHVDGANIGGPHLSLMSGGPGVFSNQIALQLTPRDLAASMTAYGAGLSPGAERQEFVQLGLLSFGLSLQSPARTAPDAGPTAIPSLAIRGR